MDKKEQKQWAIIEKAKDALLKMAKDKNIQIFAMHFVPMLDYSLEVYVFYDAEIDIEKNQINGNTEWIKRSFLSILYDVGYIGHYSDSITFIFDSHENVVNNYEGSYFLRLR
jgi:hypothetical protein